MKPAVAARSRDKGIWETIRTLFYAVLLALVVRTFLFEPFNIPSGSMKPTLLVGDYLFVSKFAYGYSKHSFPWSLGPFDDRVWSALPERGDVAVFKLPSDNRTDYIKRIIGLPGDRIQVLEGRLHINGSPVALTRVDDFDEEGRAVAQFIETLPNDREHLILDLSRGGALDDTLTYTVPEGHVFAMGDNRDNSLDSRVPSVGPVPLENLIGRAEIIFFSTDGSAALWEVWKWPQAIRYERLFNLIQ